ncbi:MAG: hypothetical protein ACRD5H_16295 [Nitrososphaerales archaeon]
MSVAPSLIDSLRTKCEERRLDFEKIYSIYEKNIGSEQPVAYCFGEGMPPDNPETLLDLLVISQRYAFGMEIKPDYKNTNLIKLSEIKAVRVELFQDRIKIILLIDPLGLGLYLNNRLENADSVWAIAAELRMRMAKWA